MTLRVFIVDDAVTFRSAIKAALANEPDIEVVGAASNGRIALSRLEAGGIDIVTLDLDMPEMDGIETTRAIRKLGVPCRILVFAAPSEGRYDQVRAVLEAGADEFVAKPVGAKGASAAEDAIDLIRNELVPKIRLLGPRPLRPLSQREVASAPPPQTLIDADRAKWQKVAISSLRPDAVVIASSTGGPMALERVFSGLGSHVNVPVLMCQHMPPPFTKSLAERLTELSGAPVREALDGERIVAGRVYVAPAEFHFRVERTAAGVVARVYRGPRINFVIPAADPLFESAADVYGRGLFGMVLTGMGEDAKLGSAAVKRRGGAILIQDQATAVVWGMPGAVHEIGAYDQMASLDECAAIFRRMVQPRG